MMKKRLTLFLSALTLILLLFGPAHALDLVYDGVDFYGNPAQSVRAERNYPQWFRAWY